MLVILILAAFISTYIYFRILLADYEWRGIFLVASIFIGAAIALLTETLNVLNALNRSALIATWSLFLLGVLTSTVWRINNKKTSIIISVKQFLKKDLSESIKQAVSIKEKTSEALIILCIATFAILLLTTAWIAPPNTNDSLYYHMSRVMNWAQNESLSHYTTPIDRQLWMPPWAEYAILNLFLLSENDSLSNLVQWFAMLGSLVGVSLTAKILGADRGGQIFTVIFCLTIPMGILQSTSTQTDYATAFWMVCLAYLTVIVHKYGLFQYKAKADSHKWLLPLLLGLTVGLGVMTKGTYFAFALPFLSWLLISILRHHHWRYALQLALLGLIVGVLLNAGVWWRNFQSYEAPMGPQSSLNVNTSFGPGVLISNLIRNSTLHLGTPYGVINGPLRAAVEWIHTRLGLDINNPGTTLDEYRVKFSRHEDFAGNPVHFIFVPLSLLIIGSPLLSNLKQISNRMTRIQQKIAPLTESTTPATLRNYSSAIGPYILVVIFGFIFFSLIFKWQTTGSRLQLPFFVLWSPIAGVAYTHIRISWEKSILIGIFILASLPALIANPSRPLIQTNSTPSIFKAHRTELLFVNSPEVMPGYLSIIEAFQNTGCHNLGLMIDSHHPDYPFWALLSPSASETLIDYYINLPDPEISTDLNSKPCAVICTICSSPEWDGLTLASIHFGGYSLYTNPRN